MFPVQDSHDHLKPVPKRHLIFFFSLCWDIEPVVRLTFATKIFVYSRE